MTGEGDPRERNERLQAEWRRAHDELTQKVHEWFVAATAGKQAAVPPIDACAAVAATLLTIKQRPEPSPGVVALKTKYRAAQRAAQKFHSAPSFGFGEAGDRVGFGQGPFDDARARAQESARQMECELSLLGAQEPQDPIRSIADAARKAWRQVGRVPRSLAPDDPLCTFVGLALEYLGMKRSQATVSEVLRGRRRRRER
jgi:hypothetical protein